MYMYIVHVYRLLFGSSDHHHGNVFHPVPGVVLIRSS